MMYRIAYNHDIHGWCYSKPFQTYAAAKVAMDMVEDLIGLQPRRMLRMEIKHGRDWEPVS